MTNYSVFIISYNRVNNMLTYKTLRKQGYTGPIYVVCGNDDPTLDQYKQEYGDHLLVFDKEHYIDIVDTIDTERKTKCAVYARIAVFDLARENNIDYFVVLDDDYNDFLYRYIDGTKLACEYITNLDKAFSISFDFLLASDANVVAWAQGGDFIGGAFNNRLKQRILRKAMNTFFCRTDRPLEFVGSVNEDVNYYINGNMRGEKIFTVVDASINQMTTQKNPGGITDTYINDGTYQKSFYSVICQPSCVTISKMGDKHFRLHHNIAWDYCAPLILNEKYKHG